MTIHKHKFEINKNNNLYTIIHAFSSHVNNVKFTLFCAKDYLHLNTERSNPIVQYCIQLVEKWLIDPNSVTKKQLFDAANAAYDVKNTAAFVAYYAAVAAHAVTADADDAAANAAYDAAAARAAYYTAVAANDAYDAAAAARAAAYAANINQQKLTQYTNYAYSLLRSTNIIPIQTKGKITDKATLMALLDELSELNEDLIIHKDNKVVLNHPANFATNTLPELVDLIWNDASLLHYLEHLYGNSQT